jgi:hypothetical protein
MENHSVGGAHSSGDVLKKRKEKKNTFQEEESRAVE